MIPVPQSALNSLANLIGAEAAHLRQFGGGQEPSGGMNGRVYNRDKLHRFLGFFMEGYTREHLLPSAWLDRLDLFIVCRRILLFTVMNDWIQSKPDLHTSWKQMILSQPEVAGPIACL